MLFTRTQFGPKEWLVVESLQPPPQSVEAVSSRGNPHGGIDVSSLPRDSFFLLDDQVDPVLVTTPFSRFLPSLPNVGDPFSVKVDLVPMPTSHVTCLDLFPIMAPQTFSFLL